MIVHLIVCYLHLFQSTCTFVLKDLQCFTINVQLMNSIVNVDQFPEKQNQNVNAVQVFMKDGTSTLISNKTHSYYKTIFICKSSEKKVCHLEVVLY